jgi:Tfp pilus assembly protein PilF
MENTPIGAARIDSAIRVSDLHYQKRKDAARAEKVLLSVATPPNIDAKVLKALKDLYTKENNWTEIARLVAQEAEAQTDNAKKLAGYQEAAKICIEKSNDPAGALVFVEKAYALDPNLRQQLADMYIAAGRLQDALKMFEEMYNAFKAARKNKDAAKCMQRMASIAAKAGDQKTAAEKYKLAYGADPSSPEILAGYGSFLFEAKEVAEASKIFRSLLLIPPGANPVMPKGEIYLRLGTLSLMGTPPDTQRANDMFKRGLEFDPQNAALKEALQKLKG